MNWKKLIVPAFIMGGFAPSLAVISFFYKPQDLNGVFSAFSKIWLFVLYFMLLSLPTIKKYIEALTKKPNISVTKVGVYLMHYMFILFTQIMFVFHIFYKYGDAFFSSLN